MLAGGWPAAPSFAAMPLSPLARLAACAAVLALTIAGCGSSSSGSSGSATSGGATKTVDPNGPEVSPAGDIPDNQAYVAYAGPGYSVKVPEGWARTTAGGGVTFTDKLNSIRAQERSGSGGAAAPPAGASVSTVTRPAGKAVRVTYVTAGKPDPVTGKRRAVAVERYTFTHTGKQLVLTLTGAKGADNVDPWKIVTSSVRWTP
ncbi:MAG: hypothetical protein QOH43_4217 [Solirubrobacteraceae bacterium]|nr:hypothetical protein [Solirubrobacteraceae bacterium]